MRNLLIPFVAFLLVAGCDEPTTGTDAGGGRDSGSVGTDAGGGGGTDAGGGGTDAGGGGTDAGGPTDAGGTSASSDASVGDTCNVNRDCAADQVCICAVDSGIDCFCQVGARGTGAVGDACSDMGDCASGLCLDVNSATLYCSDDCTDDSSICGGAASSCESVAFVGTVCVVPET